MGTARAIPLTFILYRLDTTGGVRPTRLPPRGEDTLQNSQGRHGDTARARRFTPTSDVGAGRVPTRPGRLRRLRYRAKNKNYKRTQVYSTGVENLEKRTQIGGGGNGVFGEVFGGLLRPKTRRSRLRLAHTRRLLSGSICVCRGVFRVYKCWPPKVRIVFGRNETPMSKQQANAAAKSRAKTAAPIVELGAEPHTPMRGCDIVVKCLEREGVDTVFAYPGGASMELHQALTRSKNIRTILPRHEQGGAFAADGYARACGKRASPSPRAARARRTSSRAWPMRTWIRFRWS